MNKIVFCDLDKSFIDLIDVTFGKNYRGINIETHHGDVKQLFGDNIGYISPANSFLFFDGGIDAVYGRMFPKLQNDAQELVKQFGYTRTLKKYGNVENLHFMKEEYYLPVGSSLIVPVENVMSRTKWNYIVACPTMYLPQKIKGTNNPYYATLAGLYAVNKYNKSVSDFMQIKTLICPGMGTGVGGIPFGESIKQIKFALDHFIDKKYNNDLKKESTIAYINDIKY